MNTSEFTSLLINPDMVTVAQTNQLEDIIESYPYFQAARMLHLNALKKQHSFKYNLFLKKTAAHTCNRTVLFDFITANSLHVSNPIKDQKRFIASKDVVDAEVIDQSTRLHENIGTHQEVLKTKKADTLEEVKEKLEIGKPLAFDRDELHSFNDWLQVVNLKPISRSAEEKQTVHKQKEHQKTTETTWAKKKKNFELIENFIKTNPKIRPQKDVAKGNIAGESSQENKDLMTETLARVYLEQKKYDKAIQAFKILSLKYPEKSSFFADRIKAIKFLQKNTS
ncbi:MAG: hypothetical protein CR989_00095 [Flavobacteriales bacterium]|nr:MAG: hypothetical protein CR989_00095 [Flavobacteriales bacterium]